MADQDYQWNPDDGPPPDEDAEAASHLHGFLECAVQHFAVHHAGQPLTHGFHLALKRPWRDHGGTPTEATSPGTAAREPRSPGQMPPSLADPEAGGSSGGPTRGGTAASVGRSFPPVLSRFSA